MIDKMLNSNSLDEAKKIQQAMQDMVTSASVISDSLTAPTEGTEHRMTKEEI